MMLHRDVPFGAETVDFSHTDDTIQLYERGCFPLANT